MSGVAPGDLATQASNASRRLPVRAVLGALLSAAVAVWLVRTIDWAQVSYAWTDLRVGYVALSMGLIAGHTLARGVRWRELFYPMRLPIEPVLAAMLIGQTVDYLAPTRLGDAPRIVWLGRRTDVGMSHTIGTLLVEKAWDMLLIVVVLVIVVGQVAFPVAVRDPIRAMIVFGALAIAGVAAVSILSERMAQVFDRYVSSRPEAIASRVSRLVHGVLAGLRGARARMTVARAAGWTMLAWLFGVGANELALQALGIRAGWSAALLISVALRISLTLPSMPAAVGAYEGAVVLTLSIFSIPAETALSYAIVMHVIDVVVPLTMMTVLVVRDARLGAVERGA
jgi:uncharacterized protein (TIRG00374 family)